MEIAEKAIARNTGARGLRSIMEQALRRTMFELPSRDKAERCIVNAEVIRGEGEIEVEERDEQDAAGLQRSAGG